MLEQTRLRRTWGRAVLAIAALLAQAEALLGTVAAASVPAWPPSRTS